MAELRELHAEPVYLTRGPSCGTSTGHPESQLGLCPKLSPGLGSTAGRRSFFQDQDGGFLTSSVENVKFLYHISKKDQRRITLLEREKTDLWLFHPSSCPPPTVLTPGHSATCSLRSSGLAQQQGSWAAALRCSLSFLFQLRKTGGPSLISRVPCWRHSLFTWRVTHSSAAIKFHRWHLFWCAGHFETADRGVVPLVCES